MKPPMGTRVMDSTPAQINASPAPSMIWPAAKCTAVIDEPQKRLTVAPPRVSGKPARKLAMRAMFMPCSASG
ncbi:hypothetical protein D3C84_951090 [compost metagenome]